MAENVFSECGSIYIVMQNAQLYFTFGEMTEWFMNTHDGKPSFTFELRPYMSSEYYFSLPSDQIRDTIKENIAPALYFVRHVISGETDIIMDIDGNGVNDVVENTFYDYKCDRSDVSEPDKERINDDEYEMPDDEDCKNEDDIETGDSDDGPDGVIPATEKGCNMIIIKGF